MPIEVQRLVFTGELARRYKEFGHIGIDTPFYLLHLDMSLMLEPALLAKYEKARQFVKTRQGDTADEPGQTLTEELELLRKMSLENQRHITSAERLFSEEDFVHNYEEHYPDLAEQTQKAYRGDMWRSSGDYDVPKFVRNKKPKSKRLDALPTEQAQLADGPVEKPRPAPVTFVPAPLVVVKKVKGKTKKRR